MIEWFTNHGHGILVPQNNPINESDIDLTFIITDAVANYVRTPPETPIIGRRTLKVLGHWQGNCPICHSLSEHYDLELNYGVSNCPNCKFIWYKHRDTNEKENGKL